MMVRTRATQDQRRHIAQVFVALDEQGIVGFYSLSMFTLALESLPESLARKLQGTTPFPRRSSGRLARHDRAKARDIGDLLVADAVKRVARSFRVGAAYAIVVDAKDDRGREFYASHGFVSLPSRPNRLFLLTETLGGAGGSAWSRKKALEVFPADAESRDDANVRQHAAAAHL